MEPFFYFFAYLNTSMIKRIPRLFKNCFDTLVHQHKHDKTTMFFVSFFVGGGGSEGETGGEGLGLRNGGLFLLRIGNFIWSC
jgi:hypothetical protein